MVIRILPDEVASQIAAGEVVERPASVVKELIENSLDSGAKAIVIRVEEAGRRMIEVTDNGAGIPNGEIAMAVARHATSKLASAEDLASIVTLGFRGEALASIGSVSQMVITSMGQGDQHGMILRVEGGVIGKPEPAATSPGTQVRVESLFYNVPARLKFLKTEATERRNIDAVVSRYAVAYPEVRFTLEQDGKVTLQTTGGGDRREALSVLYEARVVRQMLEINSNYPESGIHITGLVSPTSETKGNRSGLTFYVNRRLVQDNSLATAVIQAYHTLIMVGRFPFGALFVDIPADRVDVNVHPAKAEVRFRDSAEVFSAVQRAVRRGLLSYSTVPSIEQHFPTPQEVEPGRGFEIPQAGFPFSDSGSIAARNDALPRSAADLPGVLESVPMLRLIGQIGNSYLVAEGPDGLYLVDQHAAHERVLYEQMMRQRGERGNSQQLLSPAVVEISGESYRLVLDQLPNLAELGFEVEEFGPGAFVVRAVPTLLSGLEPERALRVLIEDFEEDESPLEGEHERKIIARVCKRAAVKAGQALSAAEQKALLQNLEGCQAPRTCPHGRPTMIHISLGVLERQFGRKGAL